MKALLEKQKYEFRKLLHVFSLGETPLLGGIYDAIYQKRISMELERLSRKPPLHVNIENTNLCGADCVMCPHRLMTRSKGTMSFELYKKIVDDCVTFGVKSVQVGLWGEPLLDPLVGERIKYAKHRGIEGVNLFTNAAFLTENKANEMLGSGLDLIIISLDAVTEPTFSEIRRKLDFTKTVGNLKAFLNAWKKNADDPPMVALNFTASKKNEHEIIPFIKKWTPIIKAINIGIVHDWAGQLPAVRGLKERRYPCKSLWTGLNIGWNGDVFLCCLDYDGKVILGNVRKSSVKSIWQGQTLEKTRQKHLAGRFQDIPLCGSCSGADTAPWVSWWIK